MLHPWHGPFEILDLTRPNLTVKLPNQPTAKPFRVHITRVKKAAKNQWNGGGTPVVLALFSEELELSAPVAPDAPEAIPPSGLCLNFEHLQETRSASGAAAAATQEPAATGAAAAATQEPAATGAAAAATQEMAAIGRSEASSGATAASTSENTAAAVSRISAADENRRPGNENTTCANCGQKGHLAWECPSF